MEPEETNTSSPLVTGELTCLLSCSIMHFTCLLSCIMHFTMYPHTITTHNHAVCGEARSNCCWQGLLRLLGTIFFKALLKVLILNYLIFVSPSYNIL